MSGVTRLKVANKMSLTNEQSATTEASTEQIRALLFDLRTMTFYEDGNNIQINHVSAYDIIKNILRFRKIRAR